MRVNQNDRVSENVLPCSSSAVGAWLSCNPTYSETLLVSYLVLIGNAAIWVAIAAFFWINYGPKSGRAFGNEIASYNKIQRKVFWYLLDNGAKGSSLALLKKLQRSSGSVQEASIALGPTLQRGLERLEARFGHQDMYEPAKPIIARLVGLSDEGQTQKAGEQSDA